MTGREMVSVSMKGSCGCVKCQCGLAILVRLFHLGLCIAILVSLLWHDTVLKTALVEMEAPVYGGCYVGLLCISLVLYFIACYTDPGYIYIQEYNREFQELHKEEATVSLDSEHSEEEFEMAQTANQPLDSKSRYKYRYCDYCEILPPLRSKHCEECNLCVRRYDHHCPWLENCVGEGNHKYFWFFLLTTATLIVWTFVIVWESFVTKTTWTDWFHSNIVLFLDTLVLVPSGPVVIGLFAFHTYLMLSGQSTWEVASRERITYLKYLQDDYNPFDEGCMTNIYHFLCWFKIQKWETMYTRNAKFKDTDM